MPFTLHNLNHNPSFDLLTSGLMHAQRLLSLLTSALIVYMQAFNYLTQWWHTVSCHPVSVCMSVTSLYFVKKAKFMIKQTTLHNSPGVLVFLCKISWQSSNWVTESEDSKYRWGSLKSAIFDQHLAIILSPKTTQDRCVASIKGKYEVACTLSNGDTANDHE